MSPGTSARAASCRFGSIVVEYDDAVLRPRAWTLRQSTWAAELSPSLPPGPILELCAGAGHIGLEAAVRTGRALVQVELDSHAAQLAARNAAAAGVPSDVREHDVSAGLGTNERFPLIIADPPYIPADEVKQFPEDPPLAIDGGSDGLRLIRACLNVARVHLDARGALLMQTQGKRQAYVLPRLFGGGLVLRHIRCADEDRAVALVTRG